jgi:hypothetical protein
MIWWKWFWMSAILAVVASSGFWISRNQVNGDVAIYLYAGERLADGAVLYRDVRDQNPPLIYLLQMPSVWLGRAFHVPTHVFWYLGVWVWLGIVLLMIERLGGALMPRSWLWPLLFLVAFQFGITDRRQISQKDQLAAYSLLPLVLCCAGRMVGKAPRWGLALAAALMAGVCLALKPYFLLPWLLVVLLPLFWPEWRRPQIRRWASMPEFWAVAGFHVIYWVAVLAIYPDFLKVAAMDIEYYKAYNSPLGAFLPLWPYVVGIAAICGVLYLVSKSSPTRFRREWTVLLAVGSVAAFGSLGEAIVQRKFLPYHLIPFFLFFWFVMVLAAGGFLSPLRNRLGKRSVAGTALISGIVMVACAVWTGRQVDRPIYPEALRKTFENDGRPGPILFLVGDPWCTFPVVYQSHQRMAQRDPYLWIVPGLYKDQIKFRSGGWKPAQEARYHLRGEMPKDEEALFDDLRHAMALRPRLIYVQTGEKPGLGNLNFDYLRYVSGDPELARELKDYSPAPSDGAGTTACAPRCFSLLVRRGDS